jgi:hypothetical protein
MGFTTRGATDLATPCVHLVYDLDGVQMVDPGVEPRFVQDDDASCAGRGVQRAHRGRDVGRRDDVRRAFDGGAHDGSVVRVRYERDDQVVRGHSRLQRGRVRHVERQGGASRQPGTECGGGRVGPARWGLLGQSGVEWNAAGVHGPTVSMLAGSRTRYSAHGPATNPLPSKRIFFVIFLAGWAFAELAPSNWSRI